MDGGDEAPKKIKPDPVGEGGGKRKFKPKAPRRRLVKASDKAGAPAAEPRGTAAAPKRKAGGGDRRRDGGGGRRGRGRGRGRGGRHAMPRGQAFFTGTAARPATVTDVQERRTRPEAASGATAEAADGSGKSEGGTGGGGGGPRAPKKEGPEARMLGPEEDEEMDEDLRKFYEDPEAPVTMEKFQPERAGPFFEKDTDAETLQLEENTRMYIFQLPTVLPELPSKAGTATEPVKVEGETPQPGESGNVKREGEGGRGGKGAGGPDGTGHVGDARRRLREFGNGKIGTLRVHESGRVTLMLGGCPFEVTEGMLTAFQQEVVMLDGAAGREDPADNNMVFFGHVTHKANVIPSYESLYDFESGDSARVKAKKGEKGEKGEGVKGDDAMEFS